MYSKYIHFPFSYINILKFKSINLPIFMNILFFICSHAIYYIYADLPNLLQHKLLHHMSHTVVVVGIGNKVYSFPHRKHRILHRYT